MPLINGIANNLYLRSTLKRSRKLEKAKAIAKELRGMKLKEAAQKIEDGIEVTLTYMSSPYAHWLKIRTNNIIELINREIRHRTREEGTFLKGNSALMHVCARLRHVTSTAWSTKRYMSMKHLDIAGSAESDFTAS